MTANRNINSKRRELRKERVALLLDADLIEWMGDDPEIAKNRSRYIGGLIRQDMERRWLQDWAEMRGENTGELLTYIRETLLDCQRDGETAESEE